MRGKILGCLEQKAIFMLYYLLNTWEIFNRCMYLCNSQQKAELFVLIAYIVRK